MPLDKTDFGQIYDVVIFGGGPAGAAAAVALRARGLSVALFCKPQPNRPMVGETVPPSIVRPLAKLGLWDAFKQSGHLETPGTLVAWGRDQFYENDFLFSPYGPGWHLDRLRFDGMLLSAAIDAGCRVIKTSAIGCVRNSRGEWVTSFSLGGPLGLITSRWLVDATGRAAWLAKYLGSKRSRNDSLVALVRFMRRSGLTERRTIIEASRDGWWYAASLPHGRVVTALFMDAEDLPSRYKRGDFWDAARQRTAMIRHIFPGSSGESEVSTVAAHSGRVLPCAGSDWLAIGDASTFLDPLSGQGLVKALSSALRAADAIASCRTGCGFDEIANLTSREYEEFRSRQRVYYLREERWPGSPFWQRRRTRSTQ
jgi:flavin-dependent dehydrogenase